MLSNFRFLTKNVQNFDCIYLLASNSKSCFKTFYLIFPLALFCWLLTFSTDCWLTTEGPSTSVSSCVKLQIYIVWIMRSLKVKLTGVGWAQLLGGTILWDNVDWRRDSGHYENFSWQFLSEIVGILKCLHSWGLKENLIIKVNSKSLKLFSSNIKPIKLVVMRWE